MNPRVLIPRAAALATLLVVAGCTDAPVDSGVEDDVCGDIDGEGGDTGDVPNVLGNWTVDFGRNLFDENCGLAGLEQGSETWLDGAMEIGGRVPNTLYATFNNADERFFGLESANGGIVFSGVHEDALGTMYASFGGMVYYDVHRGRNYIDGFAFIGVDTNGDGSIDCTARGEWTATRSGA